MSFLDQSANAQEAIAKQKLLRRLYKAWCMAMGLDRDPEPPRVCTPEELHAFQQAVAPGTTTWAVDERTWSDLELPRLLTRLSQGVSVLGQQLLHQRLRTGPHPDAPSLAELAIQVEARDGALDQVSAPIQARLLQMQADPALMLFANPLPQCPPWLRHAGWVPVVILFSLLALKFTSWAWAPLSLALLASGWVQIQLHLPLKAWQRQRKALLIMLDAEQDWAALKHPITLALAQGAQAQRLRRCLQPKAHHGLEALNDYLNLLGLAEYRAMQHQQQALAREHQALRQAFWRVASIEAALAWTRCLRSSDLWCTAEVSTGRQLALTDLINPLVPRPQPIDQLSTRDGGLFISGANGEGKSSVLRSVGLSLITARAFGHCFARHALVPTMPVLSSIQVNDAPEMGQSLYMSELQRAHELLQASRQADGAVLLIDELFRGTNHLESVSAAAAVLASLAERSLLLVCSHNLVLAPLLRDALVPVWLERPTAPAPARLRPGTLPQGNGLTLLGQGAWPPDVLDKAQAVMQWLQPYLAHPSHSPSVARWPH